MSHRILTLQTQARELGRLRIGWLDKSGEKVRPRRSDTWIVTSHSEDYVRSAAEHWGGTPEKWTPEGSQVAQWRVITESTVMDAILPPGDPLKQFFEKWNRGGCERRCDGETEMLSDQPCICRARYGDAFHEEDLRNVCRITSRLNVVLPQMPDIGAWRLETHSYYAAAELAAHVDLIRASTGGQYALPVRLRIEKRDRMVQGEARHYSVPVVELRGVTAGQIMSGSVGPSVDELSASAHPAITGSLPVPDEPSPSASAKLTAERVIKMAAKCKNPAQVNALWTDAQADGVLTAEVKEVLKARGIELGGTPKDRRGNNPAKPQDPSSDQLWQQILATGPFDTIKEVGEAFWAFAGKGAEDATAQELASFLEDLQARRDDDEPGF